MHSFTHKTPLQKFLHVFRLIVCVCIVLVPWVQASAEQDCIRPVSTASSPTEKKYAWEILTAWSDIPPEYTPAPWPNSLVNKIIVLRWNGKHNGDVLLNRLSVLLAQAFPDTQVIKAYRTDPGLSTISGSLAESNRITQRLVDMEPDMVIAAPGDCRACAAWLAIDQVGLERAGIPTLSLVTNPFLKTFHNVRKNLRMDIMACLVIPHPIGVISRKKLEDKLDLAFSCIRRTLREGRSY